MHWGPGCQRLAEQAGLHREGGEGQLTDALISADRAGVGDLGSWTEQITSWVTADLQLTNIHGKLTRRA